jgi:serine/threonine-protein kinase
MINAIQEARRKLEDYCFPSDLAKKITIKSDQQPIAHGAMGQLFRVNDKYAVKCALLANTIETEQALIHEIAVSRPLAHIPNLVAVYGGVRLPKYGIGIVMEYINGSSLAAALADSSTIIRNLSIRKRLHIALGIAKGLGELHLAKLVHRDFKPENVLLSQSSNGTYTPKIADFGVSFQLAIASATAVKDSCGTVGYDAPEVTIDNKTPSTASDIYALAFTLYELLTAKRVFAGLKSVQILAKFTMHGERPHDWSDDIPNPIKQAIEKAWSIEPDQRATIGEIIHAIRRSLDQNQLLCIELLQEANKFRTKIASGQFENFESFELFTLNEFVKRMAIDDCESMQMFIDKLPPNLGDK